jgi:tRNA pseudouridine32 synthase/23S rRNA pseudouridine746 synthase
VTGADNRAGPELPELEVVFADACLLVLNKPSGLLAVPGRGEDKQDCLSARAQAYYPDALVVHRLDMATSGLMLMGRGPHWQRALSRAFEQREVDKRYEAVVAGDVQTTWQNAPKLADGWALIDLPIAVDWPLRPRRVVAPDGQASQTRWRPMMGNGRVELEPVTGRTHQLRVHLQAIGHPIWGDALYADPPVQALSPRLLLHAKELKLRHPQTGEGLCFRGEVGF